MDKSVIDKMNKEEILELLSPYLSRDKWTKEYYEMLTSGCPRIELQDDVRYSKGRIDISINMVDIGSVGLAIYPDIVAKYRDMIINKIIQ